MKILKFKYTKSNLEVSERTFLPLAVPSSLYFGVDVSHLIEDEQDAVLQRLAVVMNEHEQKLKEVLIDLDLDKRYRFFIPSKMSELDTSYKGNSCLELFEEKAGNLTGS